MLADYYTKPLQGSLFKRFRDVIMGYSPIDSLNTSSSDHKLKERIENINIFNKENVSLVTAENKKREKRKEEEK